MLNSETYLKRIWLKLAGKTDDGRPVTTSSEVYLQRINDLLEQGGSGGTVAAHASSHAVAGSDPLTPTAIGAYPKTDFSASPTAAEPLKANGSGGLIFTGIVRIQQPGVPGAYFNIYHDGSGHMDLVGGGTLSITGANPLAVPGATLYSTASSFTTRFSVTVSNASYIPLYLKTAASQTANAFETRNNSDVRQFAINPAGDIGLHGATPVQSTGWAVTNVTTTKTYDADTVTLAELADVVGTLIDALKTRGDLGA